MTINVNTVIINHFYSSPRIRKSLLLYGAAQSSHGVLCSKQKCHTIENILKLKVKVIFTERKFSDRDKDVLLAVCQKKTQNGQKINHLTGQYLSSPPRLSEMTSMAMPIGLS